MKKILSVLILIISFSFFSGCFLTDLINQDPDATNPGQTEPNGDDVNDDPPVVMIDIEQAVNSISKTKIKDYLYWLADDARNGRKPGNDADTLNYIVNKFKDAGLDPVNGSYRQKFNNTANIVGMLPGNDPDLKDEIIIIGGHHDHLGKIGTKIYNGADDNASGTVGVITVAYALSQLKSQLKRTILFITFGAEEQGLIGAKYYCSNPLLSLKKTVYMVNLDMIGYHSKNGLTFLGGNNSDVVAPIIDHLLDKYTSLNGKLTSNSGGGSDHVPFKNKNIPVVFLHTGSHGCYHATCDDADRIDYNSLTNILKLSTELLYEVAQNDESPRNERYIQPRSEIEEELDHGIALFQ